MIRRLPCFLVSFWWFHSPSQLRASVGAQHRKGIDENEVESQSLLAKWLDTLKETQGLPTPHPTFSALAAWGNAIPKQPRATPSQATEREVRRAWVF